MVRKHRGVENKFINDIFVIKNKMQSIFIFNCRFFTSKLATLTFPSQCLIGGFPQNGSQPWPGTVCFVRQRSKFSLLSELWRDWVAVWAVHRLVTALHIKRFWAVSHRPCTIVFFACGAAVCWPKKGQWRGLALYCERNSKWTIPIVTAQKWSKMAVERAALGIFWQIQQKQFISTYHNKRAN